MADYIHWLRGQVGPALVPLVFATGVVRDDGGRILFQRRADFGEAWWGLPGGLVEPGESPEACVRREVLEETGLVVDVQGLTGVYSSPRYAVTYPNGDRVQQVTHCYECRPLSGETAPQVGEVTELSFFAPDALPARPPWYADMLAHSFAAQVEPYFDPPEHETLETPYQTLMDVRRVVGHAPLVWPGTSAAVLDEQGRLLLQRRGDTGTWGLPGGALDTGESLAYTIVREVREETGLEVEPVRILESYGGMHFTFPNGDVLYPVGTLFACRIIGGELRADGAESLELRFFDRQSLPSLDEPLLARLERVFTFDSL